MRYQTEQQLWTIGLLLTHADSGELSDAYHSEVPTPGVYDIKDLQFRLLTITEHHKVPGEWSDELECDGFIAVDEAGQVWENQYPRASYGQLCDKANGDFQCRKLGEMMALPENKSKGYSAVIQELRDAGMLPATYDLLRFMNELDGGLLDKNHVTLIEREYPDFYKKLQAISVRVQQAFRDATGKVLEPYNQKFDQDREESKTVVFRRWRVINPVPEVQNTLE